MSIRAVVVDDEPLARRRLKRLLHEHSDVELVGEAANGEEAVPLVLDARPDVVFLDVHMPGRDGLDALRALRQQLPPTILPRVVFTTAFEEHAVAAFELEATDYLVKPVEREALTRALRRVRESSWRARDDPARPESTAPAQSALAGHRAGKIVNLPFEDVACLLLEDTITWAHAPQGRFRVKQGLQELEERLPSPPFFRVSRAAILNLDWIEHLAPMFSGTYVAKMRPAIGLELGVSRRRARQLRELLGW